MKKEMRYFVWAVSVLMIILVAMPAWAAPKAAPKAAGPAGPLKVGMVDMQKILRESKNSLKVRTAFMKDVEKKQAAIAAKEGQIRKLEEEFGRLEPAAMEARKKKGDQIKHEMRELQYLREDAEGELKRKEVEITQKVIGEIMLVVRNYARGERFTVILDRMAVITAEESIDITDRILKLYDAQKK
ncbi:MAG: OmpH family outer membrane protein [Syntrophales bacterium]